MAYEGTPASKFIDLKIVQQHLDAATREVGERSACNFREGAEGVLRYMPSMQFDSPLEVMFWIWWTAYEHLDPDGSDALNLLRQTEVVVLEQRYRVDFLIEPTDQALAPFWTPIAIEVDGHGFHERTREQVAYRDQRDRALQAAGWKVFHFSFSEFTADPGTCAGSVFLFAKRQHYLASLEKVTQQSDAVPQA